MQECLGPGCTRGRRVSARPEQARNQAAAGLHRLERAMNRPPPRRIAGGTRADPLIGPRGTEGVGAHPVSPVRGRSIGSSTGIHGSPCGGMNVGRVGALSGTRNAHADASGISSDKFSTRRKIRRQRRRKADRPPAATRPSGRMSEDFTARRGCGTKSKSQPGGRARGGGFEKQYRRRRRREATRPSRSGPE